MSTGQSPLHFMVLRSTHPDFLSVSFQILGGKNFYILKSPKVWSSLSPTRKKRIMSMAWTPREPSLLEPRLVLMTPLLLY